MRRIWSGIASVLLLAGCAPVIASSTSTTDDTSIPPYRGPIDLTAASVQAMCESEVGADDPSGGQGEFRFRLELSGLARRCWIGMHAMDGSYCEGDDPLTGDPCVIKGVERPPWELMDSDWDNWWDGGFGDGWRYDPDEGFWDRWYLNLAYDAGTWPPMEDVSRFTCEQAGTAMVTWLCCSDAADDEFVQCVPVTVAPW